MIGNDMNFHGLGNVSNIDFPFLEINENIMDFHVFCTMRRPFKKDMNNQVFLPEFTTFHEFDSENIIKGGGP